MMALSYVFGVLMVLITLGSHYSFNKLEARLIEVKPENIQIGIEYREYGKFPYIIYRTMKLFQTIVT